MKELVKKWWFWVIVVIILLILIPFIINQITITHNKNVVFNRSCNIDEDCIITRSSCDISCCSENNICVNKNSAELNCYKPWYKKILDKREIERCKYLECVRLDTVGCRCENNKCTNIQGDLFVVSKQLEWNKKNKDILTTNCNETCINLGYYQGKCIEMPEYYDLLSYYVDSNLTCKQYYPDYTCGYGCGCYCITKDNLDKLKNISVDLNDAHFNTLNVYQNYKNGVPRMVYNKSDDTLITTLRGHHEYKYEKIQKIYNIIINESEPFFTDDCDCEMIPYFRLEFIQNHKVIDIYIDSHYFIAKQDGMEIKRGTYYQGSKDNETNQIFNLLRLETY